MPPWTTHAEPLDWPARKAGPGGAGRRGLVHRCIAHFIEVVEHELGARVAQLGDQHVEAVVLLAQAEPEQDRRRHQVRIPRRPRARRSGRRPGSPQPLRGPARAQAGSSRRLHGPVSVSRRSWSTSARSTSSSAARRGPHARYRLSMNRLRCEWSCPPACSASSAEVSIHSSCAASQRANATLSPASGGPRQGASASRGRRVSCSGIRAACFERELLEALQIERAVRHPQAIPAHERLERRPLATQREPLDDVSSTASQSSSSAIRAVLSVSLA